MEFLQAIKATLWKAEAFNPFKQCLQRGQQVRRCLAHALVHFDGVLCKGAAHIALCVCVLKPAMFIVQPVDLICGQIWRAHDSTASSYRVSASSASSLRSSL